MPSDIGPHDGRKARRKRCDACVKRKIKCHGGIPCENCKRTNQACKTPAKPKFFTPVFVGESLSINSRNRSSASSLAGTPMCVLLRPPCPKSSERDLPYFFMSFLPMNILTSDSMPISADLLAMAQSSRGLRDAIHAVAALHRKQQDQFATTEKVGKYETSEALQAYSQSVCSVQKHIASNTFLGDPTALWTTFFLGLFELMRDSTGTNWLLHFLHGTCTMLRLQHPSSLARPGIRNVQKRTFFLTTRIFEIARSLIYSSPTFLSEPEWVAALAKLWEGEGRALWHPKEALFDILPCISDLSIRAIRFCENAAHMSWDAHYALVQSLADEGLVLQKSLQQWWVETTTWNQDSPGQETDILVGYLYYHAISIYLSGTYDYHIYWTVAGSPRAPILSRSAIDMHVFEILRLSRELLAQGVAGVLLFFPLRVAGARAVDGRSRDDILSLLHTTKTRGFIVSDAFKVDLSELWTSQLV